MGKIIYKTYLKERLVRPRHGESCHVDFNAPRAVLVQKGHKELWWRFACKCWGDILTGYESEPGALMLVDRAKSMPPSYLYNDGGRLSKALVVDYAHAIDNFFGEATAEFVHIHRTLLLGRSARAAKDRK